MPHHIQQDKYNFKKTITRTGEDMDKLEPSYIVGGNMKCCRCFGKQFGSSSRSETTELLIGPTNSTLGIYPRLTKICTLLFVHYLYICTKNLYIICTLFVHLYKNLYIIIYDNQKVETNVYQLMSGISKIWCNLLWDFLHQ